MAIMRTRGVWSSVNGDRLEFELVGEWTALGLPMPIRRYDWRKREKEGHTHTKNDIIQYDVRMISSVRVGNKMKHG